MCRETKFSVPNALSPPGPQICCSWLMKWLMPWQVGLEPDVVCKPEFVQTSVWSDGLQEGGGFEDDPCIQQAQRILQGG